MKVVVIVNGAARGRKQCYRSLLPILNSHFDTEVLQTAFGGHALSLAAEATSRGADVIVAAGGDGTIHEVVNGMLSIAGSRLPVLAIYPLGSGNDFARTLGISADAEELVETLQAGSVRTIDVPHLECLERPGGNAVRGRHFINVADIGMGPEVVRRAAFVSAAIGPLLGYYVSILSVFFTYRAKPVSINGMARGQSPWSLPGVVRSLAVANGRFFGHGLCVAPDGEVDDGVLDVFYCGNVTALDFMQNTGALRRGRRISHPQVWYKRAERIELTSAEPMEVEADGEVVGWLPARISLEGAKLKVAMRR